MRKNLRFLKMRLKIAWGVLCHGHYLVIWLKQSQFEDMIFNSKIEGDVDISYIHMHEVHCHQAIKLTADKINDIDLICSKAEFEAKVSEQIK